MKIVDAFEPFKMMVEGVPDEFWLQQYRRTAREFFTSTRAWREDAPVVAGADTRTYGLTLSQGTELAEILRLEFNGDKLTKSTGARMLEDRSGRPKYFRMEGNGVVIYPDPKADVSAQLSVRVALRPTLSAFDIPDEVAERFEVPIQYGVVGRLTAMSKRPWTDWASAKHNLAEFERLKDHWRSRAADDGQMGVARKVRYGGL